MSEVSNMLETIDVFKTLSTIMSEETKDKSKVLEIFSEFQLLVDEKFIPSIELLKYENKYDLVEAINRVSDDLSFYLHFPEFIDRTVIGIHKPTDNYYKWIYNNFLKDFLEGDIDHNSLWKTIPNTNRKTIFFESVPTIIYDNKVDNHIFALNIGQNRVSISNKQYVDLLYYTKIDHFDISSVIQGMSMPGQLECADNLLALVPHINEEGDKYYHLFLASIDILVIKGKDCTCRNLDSYVNLKELYVVGELSGNRKKMIEAYVREHAILLNVFSDIRSAVLKSISKNYGIRHNFCYLTILKNIIYENSWYLANMYQKFKVLLSQVNEDLLFKNKETYNILEKMRDKYRNQMDECEGVYQAYKKSSDLLVEKLSSIQEFYGIREGTEDNDGKICMNNHLSMYTIILDLLVKMIKTYEVFPEQNCTSIIRSYVSLLFEMTGNRDLAQLLLNIFLNNDCSESQINSLINLPTESPFVKRFQIDYSDTFKLTEEKLASITYELPEPLRISEKMILGKYELNKNNLESAKVYLKEAAIGGNEEAGILLVKKWKLTSQELEDLANYGIGEAAYIVGKQLYDNANMKRQINDWGPEEKKSCLRYLHIAASKKKVKAIKLLGDFCYNSKLTKEALYYYQLAEKNGSCDKQVFDRIGFLCYGEEKYKEAMEYFKSSCSKEAYYYMGIMCENGDGCAVDKIKAIEYYKKAKGIGHTEAAVKYERLNEEIEARKKQNVIHEDKDYRSHISTSNYSSSGW